MGRDSRIKPLNYSPKPYTNSQREYLTWLASELGIEIPDTYTIRGASHQIERLTKRLAKKRGYGYYEYHKVAEEYSQSKSVNTS